jgi:hypothetical protein
VKRGEVSLSGSDFSHHAVASVWQKSQTAILERRKAYYAGGATRASRDRTTWDRRPLAGTGCMWGARGAGGTPAVPGIWSH